MVSNSPTRAGRLVRIITRSPMLMLSGMSWVTMMVVMRSRRRMR